CKNVYSSQARVLRHPPPETIEYGELTAPRLAYRRAARVGHSWLTGAPHREAASRPYRNPVRRRRARDCPATGRRVCPAVPLRFFVPATSRDECKKSKSSANRRRGNGWIPAHRIERTTRSPPPNVHERRHGAAIRHASWSQQTASTPCRIGSGTPQSSPGTPPCCWRYPSLAPEETYLPPPRAPAICRTPLPITYRSLLGTYCRRRPARGSNPGQ